MIKQIEEKDIPIIKKIFPQLLVEFSNQKKNEFSKVYILTIDNQIIGYLVLDIIYERMELVQIEVLKEKRKQGYGKKLIEFMLEEAKKRKMENITLEVRKDNDIAIHIYEKYGFKKVAIRSRYYNNIDGILMERKMM